MFIKIYTVYKNGAVLTADAYNERSLFFDLNRILETLTVCGIIDISELEGKRGGTYGCARKIVKEFLIGGVNEFNFDNVTIKLELAEEY